MSIGFGYRAKLAAVGVLFLAAFPGSFLAAEHEHIFQKRRSELVTKHDKNGDGRLDAAEREQMRLRLKDERLVKKGSDFKVPPEFLAQYDENKNGEMDGVEWKVAWEAETKILKETYDANKDGTLNKAEGEAMMADVGKGKITGIPAFFAGRMIQEPGSSKPEYVEKQAELLKFDSNGDGIASLEELDRIRKSRQQAR